MMPPPTPVPVLSVDPRGIFRLYLSPLASVFVSLHLGVLPKSKIGSINKSRQARPHNAADAMAASAQHCVREWEGRTDSRHNDEMPSNRVAEVPSVCDMIPLSCTGRGEFFEVSSSCRWRAGGRQASDRSIHDTEDMVGEPTGVNWEKAPTTPKHRQDVFEVQEMMLEPHATS